MRYLLYFLQKQYIYFLFLALEVISLLLLFNNNDYQNSALTYASNGISGSVLNMSSNISEYFSLRRVNRILAEDNAKLHSNRPDAFYKADTGSIYHNDTLYINIDSHGSGDKVNQMVQTISGTLVSTLVDSSLNAGKL